MFSMFPLASEGLILGQRRYMREVCCLQKREEQEATGRREKRRAVELFGQVFKRASLNDCSE